MKRKKYYKNIIRYFKNKTHLIITYVILSLIISGLGFIQPFIDSKIIIYITEYNASYLIMFALLSLCISIISSYIIRNNYQVSARIRNYVSLKIKAEASKELFNIEIKNFDKEGTDYFTSIIDSEPDSIASIFSNMQYSLTSFFTNVGVFIYIFIISWQIGLLFLIISIINSYVAKSKINEWKDFTKFLDELRSKYSSNFSELIRGMRDIKVLNLKDNLLKKTVYEQENYKKERLEFDKKQDRKSSLYSVFDYISSFLIVILGVILIHNNILTGQYLLIIYMYRTRAFSVLEDVIHIYEYFTKFNYSIDRLYGLIDGNKYSKEKFGNKNIKKLKGNIKANHLKFGYYDNELVLKDINFEIKEKTTIGIVGKSGQGKTTIFNLISKLYHVDDGMIYIDGYDINDLSEKSLRENISVINQNPYIFNMSIKDNLKIVNPSISDKKITQICKLCELDDFVNDLPDKYDTLVGENGVTLSGGQRQRLAIARSILKDGNIILFDEATSSLDNETQESIQKSIHKLSKDYTILIIAHRLSTVRDCDNILFVDKGKIIASGTHDELVANCLKYKKLYEKEMK